MGQFNEGRESPGALIGQLVCRSERQSVETEVCAADGTGHSGRRIALHQFTRQLGIVGILADTLRPVLWKRSPSLERRSVAVAGMF